MVTLERNIIMAKPSRQIRISHEAYEKLDELGRGTFSKKIDDILGVNRKNPVPVRKPIYRPKSDVPSTQTVIMVILSLFETVDMVMTRADILPDVAQILLSKNIDKAYPEWFENYDSYKSPFMNTVDNRLKGMLQNKDLEIFERMKENFYTLGNPTAHKYRQPAIIKMLSNLSESTPDINIYSKEFSYQSSAKYYSNNIGDDWEKQFLNHHKNYLDL